MRFAAGTSSNDQEVRSPPLAAEPIQQNCLLTNDTPIAIEGKDARLHLMPNPKNLRTRSTPGLGELLGQFHLWRQLADPGGRQRSIIAGQGRYLAALKLGLEQCRDCPGCGRNAGCIRAAGSGGANPAERSSFRGRQVTMATNIESGLCDHLVHQQKACKLKCGRLIASCFTHATRAKTMPQWTA